MGKYLHRMLGLGLLFGATFGLAGCSEEIVSDASEMITKTNLRAVADNDITGGINVVVWNGVDTAKNRLSIKTQEKIKITTDMAGVSFRIDTASDKTSYTLIPVLSKLYRDEVVTGTLKIEVPGNSSLSKNIPFAFRDIEPRQNVSATMAQVSDLMCYGGCLYLEVGDHGTAPLVEKSLIQKLIDAGNVDDQQSLNFVISGTNLKETSNSYSTSIGAGVKGLPKGNLLFGNTISGRVSETTKKKAYMEYFLSFYGENKVSAKLNTKGMIQAGYWAYLTAGVNDVLNNPGSALYQTYSDDINDTKAAFELLDYYGTHLIGQGMFGGYMIGYYTRIENAYAHTIEYDVNLASSRTKANATSVETEIDKILQFLKAKNGMATSSSGEFGFSGKEDTYLEATKASYDAKKKGGVMNGSDISTWSAGNDPNNWAIISYNQSDPNSEKQFLPITEFIVDKTSKRYKQLMNALGDETHSPYFESKTVIEQEDSPLVLADFQMVVGDNGHKKGDPGPKLLEGPDKITRVYYPMMANEYTCNKDKGYAIETSSNDFVVASDYKDHYWYYALDHADECDGIVDILFSDTQNYPGYKRRGNHANEEISGSLNDIYVWVKSGEGFPKKDLITGVGLYYIDSRNEQTFASSGGTEMGSSWSDVDKAYFNKYWERTNDTPNPDVVYQRERSDVVVDGEKCYNAYAFYQGGLIFYNRFNICYTRKPIERKMIGNDRSKLICHPTKWGE